MHFHIIKLVNHFQLLIKLNPISHPNLHIKSSFFSLVLLFYQKEQDFAIMVIWNEKYSVNPVHTYIHVNNQIIYDLINTKNFNVCVVSSNWELPVIPSTVGSTVLLPLSRRVYEIARRITEILKRNILKNGVLPNHSSTMTAALLS